MSPRWLSMVGGAVRHALRGLIAPPDLPAGGAGETTESRSPVLQELPSGFMVELTNRCKLACITCPRTLPAVRRSSDLGDMKIERFRELVDRHLSPCTHLALTGGGETLLYPSLVEAVDHVLSRNPSTQVFLSTSAMARDAVDIVGRVVDKVATLQISVDGTGEVFEQVRRPAKFKDFCDNAGAITTMVRDTRTEVTFNMVLVRENVGEVVPVVELARSMGVKHVSVTPVNLVIHEWDTSYYDLFRSARVEEAVAEARDLAQREGVELSFLDLSTPPGFRACPFLWSDLYITWDGFLVPCCARPLPKLLNFGNVFEQGLLECVNHPQFVELRRRSLHDTPPDFCLRCHLVQKA